ncbi:ATP-binding response regulator [Puia dinghuensis]|uniref:histidine kinase n=1 Tax=Puia dinghuensis TaxID=1792502 RepID=A0A8J2XSD6_9BACT|nr:ATP-binding protein [Puia dinghuensis]GGA94147.1 hybrid sensor histidine kinase/response regulator [Puia dinghuensis]
MILIVDDKPENILSLKTILELHSFPTDTALSGEEALKKILRQSYALIIVDVQMPGMDGFEVAEAISGYSKARDVPILFLSAVSTEKKFITKGYSSGGIDYITKPIDADILLLKVKTFYRLYEQNRELNRIETSLRSEIEYRKKMEGELQERAGELHSILESLPQVAFTTRADGQIEFVNEQWLNYAPSKQEFPFTHPDDADLPRVWARTVAMGEALELEIRVRRIDSEQYRFHLLRAMPIREGETIVKWVGTFTDIEDQKQAVKRKDEFISIASHELKTPLTTIKAYMQLLDRSISTGNPTKQYVERALAQVRKLDNLIVELLDLSKIESGKLKFNKKLFSFEAMLSNAIEMIQQTYPDYHITRKGTADVELYGDETRIEQVIINYLTNAVKYSPDRKEIDIATVVKPDGRLFVEVRDYGIGIRKDHQADIFSKFYRVEESANRFQGLGIGLYICAEIIRRHEGEFGVESEPGEGSAFYFSVPLSVG